MGHSNSKLKIIEFQSIYITQGPKQHRFFGTHLLLTKKNNPQELLIRKEFVFRSGQEYQHVCSQYQKIQRKPFNLIYPIYMISSGSMEHCSTVKELYVYFQIVGKPLIHIVKKQGPLSEAKAWFLLNQLSKSVQILEENGRAHWAISPQTVYRNKNENYLLYDSFFVVGPDPTNFLNSLKDSREPLSQKTVYALNRGVILSQTEGHQEDMYAIGLTLFFAVTGIHARNLPPLPKKYQVMENILMQRRAFIGQQLIRLIKQLTQKQIPRRLNNHQLRRLLRQRQTEIIKKETLEYQITHRNNMRASLKLPERQMMNRGKMEESKRHVFNSPDRVYNKNPMYHNEHSSKLDLRVIHKSNNLSVTPQSVSHNYYESTWETKRSAILPHSRHDISIEKNLNLTRILSYDKLLNKR